MEPERRADSTVHRRALLGGAAAAAAGTAVLGGIPGILAHAQAPAYPKGTKLQLLQWSHFGPAADTLSQQAAEFGKQAGVEIAIERINQNDIQARMTAAVQTAPAPTSSSSSPTTILTSTRARWST
jgi:ABC-type glycerol-3-phosphate transport system substrate-binding protein